MKDIVKGLTLRSVLEFLLPGAYLLGMAAALASSCGLLYEYSLGNPSELPDYMVFALDELAMGALFFVVALLVGMFLYALNLPERLPFYRDALATVRIAKHLCKKYYRVGMGSNVELRSQVHSAFFRYFEGCTAEQKNRTHKLVSLYSIAVNIAAISLALVPLSMSAYFELEADFFENYGLLLVFILLLSTLSAYGLFFFGSGVRYLFNRQLYEFIGSPEYRSLDSYFRRRFVRVARKVGDGAEGEGIFLWNDKFEEHE